MSWKLVRKVNTNEGIYLDATDPRELSQTQQQLSAMQQGAEHMQI